MSSQVLAVFDELLRSPRAIAERSRADGDLRPLFVASLAALVLGAGVFGATLATSRGGWQLLYSGVKLPLAMLVTMLLVVPAFHAIAAGLGRSLRFSGMIALTLAAAGRGALVLIALAPLIWLSFDRGLSYHPGVLLASACYGLAGLAALDLVLKGVGFDARGFLIVSLFAGVLFATGAQTAWMFRPFLGRPSDVSVPFFRQRESSFWDALQQSSLASFGVYRVTRAAAAIEGRARSGGPGPRLENTDESR
jgi:hypothetical protein